MRDEEVRMRNGTLHSDLLILNSSLRREFCATAAVIAAADDNDHGRQEYAAKDNQAERHCGIIGHRTNLLRSHAFARHERI
jgi:hypothetical protein